MEALMPTKGQKRQREGPVCISPGDDWGHPLTPVLDAATQRKENVKKERNQQKQG